VLLPGSLNGYSNTRCPYGGQQISESFPHPRTRNEVISHVRRFGVEIIEGPVERTGATGSILSFCFMDPDNNLIEVANDV
jgi:catechol 2,3-dioxygenase-like lactoylglutathione lyase family enzyme